MSFFDVLFSGEKKIGATGIQYGSSIFYYSSECIENDGDIVIDLRTVIKNYNDDQLNEKFNEMLVDMNLTEEKKSPLKIYDRNQKISMLLAYSGVNSIYEKPSDYINDLVRPDLPVNKLKDILKNLRISLTNNTLTWIEEFGEHGIQTLVNKLKEAQNNNEDTYLEIENECIKCLHIIMNNTIGIKSIVACKDVLPTLAQSLNKFRQHPMLNAVKVLVAMCSVPGCFEKVLDVISMAGVFSNQGRFEPIVDGLKHGFDPLKVACMELVNAIIGTPDDLDFRIQLRNEFVRLSLLDVIEDLSGSEDKSLLIQFDLFDQDMDDDHDKFEHRFDD